MDNKSVPKKEHLNPLKDSIKAQNTKFEFVINANIFDVSTQSYSLFCSLMIH